MAQEPISEGSSVDFMITPVNEPAFDFILCFLKRKVDYREIAKFAHPEKEGFILMSKNGNDYTCEVPKENTIGVIGPTQIEVHLVRGGKTEIPQKEDYRPIVNSLSPLSK